MSNSFSLTNRGAVPRRWVACAIVIFFVAALFPYGYVAKFVPSFNHWLNANFSTERAHHAVHVVIFSTAAFLLLAMFPWFRRHFIAFLGVIACAGAVQEGLQLMYKNRLVASNDGKDVLVDLAAATVVFATWRAVAKVQEWARGREKT
jgi:hypothetical protein